MNLPEGKISKIRMNMTIKKTAWMEKIANGEIPKNKHAFLMTSIKSKFSINTLMPSMVTKHFLGNVNSTNCFNPGHSPIWPDMYSIARSVSSS